MPPYNSYVPTRASDEGEGFVPRTPRDMLSYLPTETNRLAAATMAPKMPVSRVGVGGAGEVGMADRPFIPGNASNVPFIPGTTTPMTEYNIRQMGGPDSSKVTERRNWLAGREQAAQQVVRDKAIADRQALDFNQALQLKRAAPEAAGEAALKVAGVKGETAKEVQGMKGQTALEGYHSKEAIAQRNNEAKAQLQTAAAKAAMDRVTTEIAGKKEMSEADRRNALLIEREKMASAGDLAGAAELGKVTVESLKQQMGAVRDEKKKLYDNYAENTPEGKAKLKELETGMDQLQDEMIQHMGKLTEPLKAKKVEGADIGGETPSEEDVPQEALDKATNILRQYSVKDATELHNAGKMDNAHWEAVITADEALKTHEKAVRARQHPKKETK